jgi:hypothetical protein
MIDQVEEHNILVELIGWVAFSMLAIFFIGFSIYFGSDPLLLHSIANNEFVDQAIGIAGNISVLGGGVLIAGCQWMFLRHLLPQIHGGGWFWVASGVVSSISGFVVVAISMLGLGDYPTKTDYLFVTFLIVSEQLILLSIVQGLLLRLNTYNRVGQWVIINILGYGLAVIISYILIYRWAANFEALIALPALFIIFATCVSGWGLMRVLESHEGSQVD